jgi:hypothetical protein
MFGTGMLLVTALVFVIVMASTIALATYVVKRIRG